jgi:hypothetical protein
MKQCEIKSICKMPHILDNNLKRFSGNVTTMNNYRLQYWSNVFNKVWLNSASSGSIDLITSRSGHWSLTTVWELLTSP